MPRDFALTARSRRTFLLALLVLAFALRIGWSLTRPADAAFIDALPDQREYLSLAESLRAGDGLQFFDARFGEALYAFRPPLYPAFVAACGANVRAVQVIQAAIDASTVLAIYLLSRALLRRETAGGLVPFVAAGFVAFNPFLVYFAGLVLTETLSTALLAWGMLLLLLGGRGGRLFDDHEADPAPSSRRKLGIAFWLGGGLLLALSGLVRPSAVPLTILLGYGAAFVHANREARGPYLQGRLDDFEQIQGGHTLGSRPDHRRRAGKGYPAGWPLPVGATMLLLTAIVLFPWGWRNARVVNRWVWTTTNGGVTFYDGFNPDATGASDQSFLKAMPQLRRMREVGRSDYLSELAKQFVREHPRRALELAAIKAGRTWSPVPLSQEYGSRKNRIVGLLYAGPFYLLVLIGLAGSGLRRSAKAYLLLPAMYFTLVHMASVGSLRYRIPVEPPMAVIAASAFVGARPLTWRWARPATDEPI